jgi:D-alanyl-D-alanine carboxypeptidase/D-alanyl-D-alanine-endopeptidase (penicillin-binding protein 4)
MFHNDTIAKRLKITALMALFFLSLFAHLFAQELDSKALGRELEKLMSSKLVGGAEVAVAFYNPATCGLVWGHKNEQGMIPASLQKLYTGIGALETLGPQYQFTTKIGSRGEIVDGVLKGDLIVVGGGDPSWMEDFYPKGPHQVFEAWADSLRALGIRKIEGNLIGNISLFPTLEKHPLWEKHNLHYGFSPGVGALCFNENKVRFELEGAAKAGQKASATPSYNYKFLKVDNRIETVSENGAAGIWLKLSEDGGTVTLHGKLGTNTKQKLTAAVRNPPLFTMTILYDTFRKKGITITGKILLEDGTSNNFTPLFSHKSPSLAEILAVMQKYSSNMLAEQMLSHIGPGAQNGVTKLMELMAKSCIGGEFHVVDGSGLSRQNLCSASNLGLALCLARHQEWFDFFLQSLATPGEIGTLKRRFPDLKEKSVLFGKTGSLRDVSNLAGYLRAGDDQLYVFVIMCNKVNNVANARKWQENVCNLLLKYNGR